MVTESSLFPPGLGNRRVALLGRAKELEEA